MGFIFHVNTYINSIQKILRTTIDCSCVLWKTILLKFSLAWEIPSEVLETSQRAFCRATLLNGFPHGRDLNLVLGFSSNLHHDDKHID